MSEQERTYLCIDLKSFYASVECMERGLDPLTTNLVVADASRTDLATYFKNMKKSSVFNHLYFDLYRLYKINCYHAMLFL